MRNFTHGSILRHLIAFSVPIILADFLRSIYIIIDALWVGRILGPEALAAVSTTFPLIFLLFSIIIGLSIATNILVGQSYGANNSRLLSKVITNSFFGNFVLCAMISFFGITLSKPLLTLINTPESIRADAHTYFVIILGGIIFRTLFHWFSGVLKGLGDSKTPFKLLAISVLSNLVLTPLLIIGPGPLPSLGIAGSALGTVISEFIAMVLGYIYLIRENHLLNIGRWQMKLDMATIKKLFVVGIPLSAQMVIRSLSWVAVISFVNRFGAEVTAAYGIGIRIDMFAFMPALSVGLAVSSMAAQNLGASQKERVSRTLKYAVIFSFCLSAFFFVVVNVFPRQIASFFTRDASVIGYAQDYWRIISFGYLVFSFIFPLQGVIRGAGDTAFLLLFTVISMLVFRVPLAYFLSGTALRETGIWLAILTSAFVAAGLNWSYYLKGRWRTKVVMETYAVDV